MRIAASGLAALVFAALCRYKLAGALRTLRATAGGSLPIHAGELQAGGVGAATLHYLEKIAPALAFGILLGGALSVALSLRCVPLPKEDGVLARLAFAAAGMPLMLCSCCVTPVFTAVRERTGRLAGALTVMLASPGLNVAAIALTVFVFPVRVAACRAVASIVLVLALPALVARGVEARRSVPALPAAPAAPRDVREVLGGSLRSAAHLAVFTVPTIVAGALASAGSVRLLHASGSLGAAAGIALAASVGAAVALPTFVEIPLALGLLSLGAPAGAAMAILVAGPIVNLPSLFVVAREAGPRAALVTYAGVTTVAFAAGAFAQWLGRLA